MLNAYEEFYSLVSELYKREIKYALIGGIAIGVYGLQRMTKDIDILVLPQEVPKVKELLESKGYFESAKPLIFKNSGIELHRFMKIVDRDNILFDVLVALESRHQSMVDRAGLADWRDAVVRLALKDDLVSLKQDRNSGVDQDDIKFLQST